MNYKCPICGKIYTDVNDFTACVQKCAKESENKEKRATALAEEITKTYTKLKGLIGEYNGLNTGKIYASTLSSNSGITTTTTKSTIKGDNATKPNMTAFDSYKNSFKPNKKKVSEDSEFEKFFKESFNIKEPKSNSEVEKKILSEDEFAETLSEIFNSIIEGTREDEFAKTLSEIFNS